MVVRSEDIGELPGLQSLATAIRIVCLTNH